MTKPDCYKCKHRGRLEGNAHSKCVHPATNKIHADPLCEFIALFGGCPPVNIQGFTIKFNPVGIRRGWAMWPFNFDPVWLEECSGFEEAN